MKEEKVDQRQKGYTSFRFVKIYFVCFVCYVLYSGVVDISLSFIREI